MASAPTTTTSNQPVASSSDQSGRTDENNRQDAKFLEDYRKFCVEFDELASDSFKGEELETLAGNFLERHRLYLAQFVLEFPAQVKAILRGTLKNPTDLGKLNENLEDDLKLIRSLVCVPRGEQEKLVEEKNLNVILADLYRRTSQACYLRVTFNKSRFNREEDRREPLAWSQLAIRHDPSSFLAWWWYMITVGRYSDSLTNPRDRTLAGEAFKRGTLRCLQMDPNDSLAHNLLGRYYFHIASLSWIQRAIVKKFFNFNVEGSFQDSEREFRLANSLKDDWLPNGLWMARVLMAQNRSKQEIKKWIELALKMEANEPTTEIERMELLELGRKLKMIN